MENGDEIDKINENKVHRSAVRGKYKAERVISLNHILIDSVFQLRSISILQASAVANSTN